MRTFRALAAALLLVAPALTPRVRDRVATRSATAGQKMRDGHFEITGGRGCPNNVGVPQITVPHPPAHGAVVVRRHRGARARPYPLFQGRELRGTHI